MMRTISVRNAYKVIGSEPSPYTNKVYAYMRYKNIPFANVPGWFPIKKTLAYTACTEIIKLMQIRTFYGGRRTLQSTQWTAGIQVLIWIYALVTKPIKEQCKFTLSYCLKKSVGLLSQCWLPLTISGFKTLRISFITWKQNSPIKRVLNAFIILRPSYI